MHESFILRVSELTAVFSISLVYVFAGDYANAASKSKRALPLVITLIASRVLVFFMRNSKLILSIL